MPPTSEPDRARSRVLVDGLAAFELVDLGPLIEAAARTALAGQGRVDPEGAEVSITFVDDTTIAALNRRWLDRDGPTDVISFGLGEDPLVADIYVSAETARANADHYGVPLREELARLVVHGVLHAAGHDHPDTEARGDSPMFELQERLLREVLDPAG